jgi:hypothetical protein
MANRFVITEPRKCEGCGKIFVKPTHVQPCAFRKRRFCSRACSSAFARSKYTPGTHHMSRSPEFRVWWAMRQRCTNANNVGFPDYGGRGITVCERWISFEAFLADMGHRPTAEHSLDRIDVNGNYDPKNCRWATRAQQVRNRRDNVYVTIGEVTKVLEDWAADFGISPNTVRHRINKGMSPEEALTRPTGDVSAAKSGVRGVYEHPGRPKPWQVRLGDAAGRFRSFGYYRTKEEAATAASNARQRLMVAHGVGVPV